MTRAILEVTAISNTDVSPNTNVIAAAQVYVYETDGVTRLAQSIYAASAGGSPLTQPLTANSLGVLVVYADTPQECVVRIGSETATAYKTAFRPNTVDVPLRPQLPINAKAPPYNLVGDDVTDDTTALQTLLDALANDDAVYLPKGTYRISNTLTLSSRSRVELSGHPGTVIHQVTAGKGGITITGCDEIVIDSVNFQGPGTLGDSATSTELGIRIQSSTTAVIHRSKLTGFGYQGMNISSASATVDTCTIVGTGQNVHSSVNAGVVVSGGKSTLINSRIDNYSIAASSSTTRTKVIGCAINQDTPPTGIDIALYVNGYYQIVEGNHVYGGIKCSFTADESVINGNILTGGGNLWLTYVNGGIVSNNTIEGARILLGADGGQTLADVLLRAHSTQFVHNTIRNTPLVLDGVVTLGAITGSGINCVFDSNLIEYSFGHGMCLYDAGAAPMTNNTIRNNTFRKCSYGNTGTFDGVQLGGGFGESISGLRFYGNTFDSPTSTTSTNAVTTSGSPIISLTSAAEAAKFVQGDGVTGAGIPVGARVLLSGMRIYPTGNPTDAGTPGLVLTMNATASATITITRTAQQVVDCLDLSQAAASTIEVWGNAWGSPTTNKVNLGGVGHTYVVNFSHSQLNVGPVSDAASASDGEIVTTGAVKSGHGLWLGGYTDYHFEQSQMNVANGAAQKVLTDTDPVGFAYVINTLTGRGALFSLAGSNAVVLLTADATTAAVFSHTSGTGGKSNVYRDGADSLVKVQNSVGGGAILYAVLLFTQRSGSGTF